MINLALVFPDLFFLIMLFQFIFKKKKNFQKKIKSQSSINEWMALTKEERLRLDFKEKIESMRKKNDLLETIRKEYIKIKNKEK